MIYHKLNNTLRTYTHIFFTLLFIFQGCEVKNQNNSYGDITNRSYDQFNGKSLFIRDFELNGNPIVFLYDYTISYKDCGYLIFTGYRNTDSILDSRVKIISQPCFLEPKKEDSSLVKQFLKLGFRRLMVDKGNVYISTKDPESFNMVKIINLKDRLVKYKGWANLKNNWFVKP